LAIPDLNPFSGRYFDPILKVLNTKTMNQKSHYLGLVAESSLINWHQKDFVKWLFSLKILLFRSVKGFVADFCPLHASALTLYSLLSIVPVFALLFGVAKGFGYEIHLKQRMLEQVPNQETMLLQILGFAENILAETKGGLIAGIGIVVLVWSGVKVMSNIEDAFNAIWKIKQSRPLQKKLTDYISFMFLAPVLALSASSMTVFVKTHILDWLATYYLPELGVAAITWIFGLSPLVIMFILFTSLYLFIPNQKIAFKSAMLGGIIASLLYQILQWSYLSLQMGVSGYNAIYGSFAALPLFLVWLQTGWMIVLFGCEVVFFHQNPDDEQLTTGSLSVNLEKAIALEITRLILLAFIERKPPYSIDQLAEALDIPSGIINELLIKLINARLIVELKTEEGRAAVFQPGLESTQLRVAHILEAIDSQGLNELPEMKHVKGAMQFIRQVQQQFNQNTQHLLVRDWQIHGQEK
jgi:membrane protein